MLGLIIGIALVVFLIFRVMVHFHDKKRILASALSNGWQEVGITWDPFAPGWFFEGQERHYSVSYLDENGVRRERYCELRLLGSLYWKDPDPIELPPPPDFQA